MSGGDKHHKAAPWVHALSGTVAGGVATVALHPLDLLKTRLQVQDGLNLYKGPRYQGLFDAIRSIFVKEGLIGFYKGLSPNVIGSSASWGIYFYAYTFFKNQWVRIQETKTSTTSHHIFSAIQAGVVTSCFTNPIWVVKTRMQLQASVEHNNYRGVFDALRVIWREEGFIGFYKGFIPALFGVSHGVVQFATYEELKKITLSWKNPGQSLDHSDVLVIGGVSKVFASAATYPYQVVKSRLQERPVGNVAKYSGVIDVISKILKYEGVYGFYKGLIPNLLRVTPSAAITFLVYEYLLALYSSKHLPS